MEYPELGMEAIWKIEVEEMCIRDRYKTINSLLYKKISTSDVRKQWWVDENLKSDALSGLSWGSSIGNDISTLEI